MPWTWIVFMYFGSSVYFACCIVLVPREIEHSAMYGFYDLNFSDIYSWRVCSILHIFIANSLRHTRLTDLCVHSFDLNSVLPSTDDFLSLYLFRVSLYLSVHPIPIHIADTTSLWSHLARSNVHLDDELEYLIAYSPFEKSIKCFLIGLQEKEWTSLAKQCTLDYETGEVTLWIFFSCKILATLLNLIYAPQNRNSRVCAAQ